MFRRIVCLLALSALSAAPFLACSADAECPGNACPDGGSASSSSSSSSSSSGVDCKLDAPGPAFTFHVTNGGTRSLRLAYGCGATLPLTVDTPSGKASVSPGPSDVCEVACDTVYKGQPNNGCSDCGPGTGASLAPGKTVDIPWDRRVFTEIDADPVCTGSPSGNHCALGTRVDPSTTKTGTLTLCSDTMSMFAGGCPTANQEPVPFQLDLSKSELTISVK